MDTEEKAKLLREAIEQIVAARKRTRSAFIKAQLALALERVNEVHHGYTT